MTVLGELRVEVYSSLQHIPVSRRQSEVLSAWLGLLYTMVRMNERAPDVLISSLAQTEGGSRELHTIIPGLNAEVYLRFFIPIKPQQEKVLKC